MTEASYQAGRKVMQRANYLRGMITEAKESVAKWTRIDSAAGTQKTRETLEKAEKRLKEWRDKFEALQFPDPNLKVEDHRCGDCGRKLKLDELCTCIYQ